MSCSESISNNSKVGLIAENGKFVSNPQFDGGPIDYGLKILVGLTQYYSIETGISIEERIIRKWQVESFESPAADSMAQVRIKAVDTITIVDNAIAAYLGTHNLDSIKAILKSKIEDYKEQQKDMAAMTSLVFFKNGLAVFYSGPQSDTSKWFIVGKNKLVLAPYNDAQRRAGAKVDTAIIESIGSGKVRLKINQGKNFMYTNMRTFTKDDSVKANEVLQKQQQLMQAQVNRNQRVQSNAMANSPSVRFPNTSERLLTKRELSRYSRWELKIMRNEIFAKYGYIFKSEDLRNYFNKQSWYKPRYSDVSDKLTAIEKENVATIKSME